MAKRKVFDVVKRRSNQFGTFYNCRFAPKIDSIPSLEAMGEAIEAETGREGIEWRARGDGQVDRNGRVWIDVYFRAPNPFELAAEQAEVAS